MLALIMGGVVAFGYWDQYRYDAKVPLGTWYGTFTSPTGLKGAMLVVVTRKHRGQDATYMGSSNGVYFLGSAQLCFTGQARQFFRLSGSTDQSGPGFTFGLIPVHGPSAGLRFSEAPRGVRHQDTLAMTGQLIPFAPPGAPLPSSDTARRTPFTLVKDQHQGFAETCRALRAQRK